MKSMRIPTILLVSALYSCASSGSGTGYNVPDASDEPTIVHDPLCAKDSCGILLDKVTGESVDCGLCSQGYVCGDNGRANVCGNACVRDSDTTGCDYVLGPNWALYETQYPIRCLYVNLYNCIAVQGPQTECGANVCGYHWCCSDDPTTGGDLLPGAVAQ